MWTGSMVALVTPMQDDGSIDKQSFIKLIEWHIESGTKALIIAGTTGESATLNPDEHAALLKLAVEQADKRIPIIAGTGTNATSTTLKLIDNARNAQCDGCLIVTPYYNKPSQKGLIEHFTIAAKHADMPIILYNVPGRTACDMLPETVAQLAKVSNIVGIKEATGKIERAIEISKLCGSDFLIYSGDDATALELMTKGAKGVISVTANVAPLSMVTMCDAALHNDFATAKQINDRLMGLHQHLFAESNPVPTKWALAKLGKIPSGIRLPLLKLDSKYHETVTEAMLQAGVL